MLEERVYTGSRCRINNVNIGVCSICLCMYDTTYVDRRVKETCRAFRKHCLRNTIRQVGKRKTRNKEEKRQTDKPTTTKKREEKKRRKETIYAERQNATIFRSTSVC